MFSSSAALLSVLAGSNMLDEAFEHPEAPGDSDAMWENELARRVRHEPDVFLALYDRYYERILSYLYRRTMNLEEAQDLTSQTFLQAFEALRTREQRVFFRAWIYRIATNLHTSHVRRLCRWACRVSELGMGELRRMVRTPRDHASIRQDSEVIRIALNALSEEYRIPLILRFDEELGTLEIASILNLTESGVRTRIARALRLLQAEIAAREGR